MYRRAVVIPISTDTDHQLRCVNQKLADLSARRPYSEVGELFALAAYLASEAVKAAASLQGLPGGDAAKLEPVTQFWRALSNHAHAAALVCGGDSKTLPHALVAFNFLRNLGEDV
jgi:hypothetical protein